MVTVGFLGLGWTISEFAKRYSGAGTLYEYVAHSLGKRPAVLTSALYAQNRFALPAFATATYNVGNPGTGTLTLTATGTSASDNGSFSVPVRSAA